MGKVKRGRQKFHLAKVKSMSDLTSIEPNLATETYETDLPAIPVSTNLFADVDIPLTFNHSLEAELKLFDDAKSIVSTKSNFKDRNLTKKQKRTMRHDAFLQKLEVISQARQAQINRRKTRNKKSKPVAAQAVPGQADPAQSLPAHTLATHAWMLPTEGSTAPESRAGRTQVRSGGRKSLLKAKQRQKQALKDVGAFKEVLNDPEYRADPIQAIFSRVHQKIRKELEDE